MNNNQNTAEILSEIYRGAKMGVETINSMLNKVNDNKIYDELKYQLRSYDEIANEAYGELVKRNQEPKDISTMNKLSAKMSVGINTMISNTPSHIADMLIKGSTMGVTGMTKSLNSCKDADPDIQALADRFIKLEQDNIERLMKFL
jgi:hypothetical protein